MLFRSRVGGLVIAADPFANSRIKEIAALALRSGLPAIFVNPQSAAIGGLMSYGGNIVETHRLAGIYLGRILKGEKPADLPVIQGTKVEGLPPERLRKITSFLTGLVSHRAESNLDPESSCSCWRPATMP